MTERTCTYFNRRRQLCCTECGLQVLLCKCEDPDDAAFKRITSMSGRFLQAVMAEVREYEGGTHLLELAMAELGSVAQKLVQNDRDRSVPDSEVQRELVKLAATITMIASIGTPEYAYPAHEG